MRKIWKSLLNWFYKSSEKIWIWAFSPFSGNIYSLIYYHFKRNQCHILNFPKSDKYQNIEHSKFLNHLSKQNSSIQTDTKQKRNFISAPYIMQSINCEICLNNYIQKIENITIFFFFKFLAKKVLKFRNISNSLLV